MIARLVTPFRVGLLVIGGMVAFFALLSVLGRQKYDDSQSYELYAIIDDASGLGAKSRIQIAGIEIGIIDRIKLTSDARARVTLRIRNDVKLREDAYVIKRSASLLGDFLLDVFPGTPGLPEIPRGGEIRRVVVRAGVEDVFATLGDVTRDIQGITRSLSDLLDSEEGVGSIKEIIASMNDLSQGLNRTIERSGNRLDNILGDVEALSHDMRGLARGQQRTIEQILANLHTFTDQANRLVATVNGIVGSGEDELKHSVASVRMTLDDLQSTLAKTQKMIDTAQVAMDDTQAMVASVGRGEGTLGKLLRDDGIARNIDQALEDLGTITRPIGELQTEVTLREEIHFGGGGQPAGKAMLQLLLRPRPDKFYGVEVVSDPRGTLHRETIRRENADGGLISEEIISTLGSGYRFSAYFGKRLGPTAFRAGLIESTGGVGTDLYLFNDRLRFTVDAFDWSNPDKANPRLRASAQISFLNHFFLGAGVDDALNRSQFFDANQTQLKLLGRDFFASGGFFFTDDDLKALIAIMGIPVPR